MVTANKSKINIFKYFKYISMTDSNETLKIYVYVYIRLYNTCKYQ